MASNARTRTRKAKAEAASKRWLTKFVGDMEKITSTGDVPTHYVGGGQAYTRGKKPTLGERLRPHLRRVFNK